MPNIPIQVRLPHEECDALDNYRREQRNPPSRAQAARALINQALNERHAAATNHPATAAAAAR